MKASNPKPDPMMSLRQVAEAAGVSRMTVSRAFRPEASMRPELRERVLAIARQLGYEPDRMVTELMTSFVKRRPIQFRETLAVLWWPERWSTSGGGFGFNADIRLGIEASAARHGCGIEHLVMTASQGGRALTRMLKARGIVGVVLTPQPAADTPPPNLDWDSFCAVTIGTSLRKPDLHRAQVGHYSTMVQVLDRLHARGHRRPCLLLRLDLEERMRRAYAAAFNVWEHGGDKRIWRSQGVGDPGVNKWLARLRPDVVIADTDQWYQVLSEASRKVGFVSLAVDRPEGDISGNHQNIRRVAEGAVDLLMQARLRHELGEPVSPQVMLTSGAWIEGRTLYP